MGGRSSKAPSQSRRRPRRSLGYWIILAAILHAELGLVIGLATYFFAPREAELAALRGGEAPESIDISTMDEETSRKIVAELEKQEEKAQEEEKKKEEESQRPPGQVVDLAKPREEKRAQDAKFASEYDSSVQKEMKKYGKFDQKSRQGDAEGKAADSKPAVPPTPPTRPTPPSPPGAMAMRTPGPKSKPSPPGAPGMNVPSPTGNPGESVEAPPDKDGELAQKGTGMPSSPRPPTSNGGPPPSPNVPPSPPSLTPSEQQLARAVGSGTQDYLKDIDEGEETALNAKKWKFASFFNRVKQQVRDHWRPAEEYRRRDPSGSIYGHKDRYTLLRVQLKPDGSLANVALELPSGVEFLDDEAIEAFKQAQPFPNPPKQLVETDGHINFRFGFFFELSGAPKMRILKYDKM